MKNGFSPVNTDGKESEDTSRDGDIGDKVVDAAIHGAKLPHPKKHFINV